MLTARTPTPQSVLTAWRGAVICTKRGTGTECYCVNFLTFGEKSILIWEFQQYSSELHFGTARKVMDTCNSHDTYTYKLQFEDTVCPELEQENTMEHGRLSKCDRTQPNIEEVLGKQMTQIQIIHHSIKVMTIF
jgi:hypothetical protein